MRQTVIVIVTLLFMFPAIIMAQYMHAVACRHSFNAYR